MKWLRFSRKLTLFVISCGLLSGQSVGALSPVLISGVQVKGVGTNVSTQEVVEVRNYSEADVDVTHWCIAYASYGSTSTPASKGCAVPTAADDKVFLRAGKSFVFTTNDMTTAIQLNLPDFTPDGVLLSGLNNETGQVFLVDSAKAQQDNIAWFTGSDPIDGQINLKATSGQPQNISFKRGDVTTSSFQVSPLPLEFEMGGLYEAVDACMNITDFQADIPEGYFSENGSCFLVDVCSNIDGIQTILPDEMTLYEGACVIDECASLEGLQLIVPESYEQIDGRECVIDMCSNIEGLQTAVPATYYQDEGLCHALENRALMLSEVLPNASGADAGFEYIEIYNPHDETISLSGYRLLVGKALEKPYAFMDGAKIESRGYVVVTDAQIGFTLLNTNSQVGIMTPAGDIVDTTSYIEPKDDMAWALLDDVWQYSNRKTPGAPNLASYVDPEEDDVPRVATLAPCGEGKYRHPLTNRCRNIESDIVTLASCDSDEYRNPETNRCRKITPLTSSLAPCGEGQERNPDTNRCRSVLAATSILTPCQPGQERNPETNRCRNIPEAAEAASVVASTADSGDATPSFSPYMIATGAAGLALGYGIFEWRGEISRLLRKVTPSKK